jgi:signal transduction histidine kinase
MCPHCRQNAPIIYRGIMAYCTACNAPRPPFSGKSVNLAGQGSMIGGTLAHLAGWIVLAGGTFATFLVAWVLGFVFSMNVAIAFGVPLALVTLLVSLPMLFGGKKLAKSGEETRQAAQFEAIYALASNRGGVVTALDAARSLAIAPANADALLTTMTKQYADYVSVEVDDAGQLFYRLTGVGQPSSFGVKYRVEPDGRVRIADELAGARAEQAHWEAAQAESAERADAARRGRR